MYYDNMTYLEGIVDVANWTGVFFYNLLSTLIYFRTVILASIATVAIIKKLLEQHEEPGSHEESSHTNNQDEHEDTSKAEVSDFAPHSQNDQLVPDYPLSASSSNKGNEDLTRTDSTDSTFEQHQELTGIYLQQYLSQDCDTQFMTDNSQNNILSSQTNSHEDISNSHCPLSKRASFSLIRSMAFESDEHEVQNDNTNFTQKSKDNTTFDIVSTWPRSVKNSNTIEHDGCSDECTQTDDDSIEPNIASSKQNDDIASKHCFTANISKSSSVEIYSVPVTEEESGRYDEVFVSDELLSGLSNKPKLQCSKSNPDRISVEEENRSSQSSKYTLNDKYHTMDNHTSNSEKLPIIKNKYATMETQTSIGKETDRPRSSHGTSSHDYFLESDLRQRFRSSCRCKRQPEKSASWSEADFQADFKSRQSNRSDSNKPISVTYYYGKLIQVDSCNQVQIGDNNTMDINLAQSGAEFLADEMEIVLDEDGDDEAEEEFEENEVSSYSLCSECRSRLTDDEKSLLPPLSDSSDSQCVTPRFQRDMDSLFDETSNFSESPVPDGSANNMTPYSSDDDGTLSRDSTHKKRPRGMTFKEYKEQHNKKEDIFVQARIKIYNATAEHRRRSLETHEAHKIFKSILKRKKQHHHSQ